MITGRFALLIVALAIVAPCTARSQSISTLEGVVRDENGGVALARVTAVDSLTNERRGAVTNERGFFRMLDLSPGRYVVSARVIGYAPVTRNIRLVTGQRAEIDLVLTRSPNLLQTVRVQEQRTAAASIERMSVSTVVGSSEIQRLPLNSRNVMNLAAVSPGIRSFQSVSGNVLPSAGSLREERGINLYVDGVELKNMNSGNVSGAPQSGSLIPVDAVDEFRLLLNPYDAEYTRGVAYVMSVTTFRGTNETHGSTFGYFQDRALVSMTDFQRGIPNFEKPDFNRQQGGFSLRGPVIRDRLFYSASYELSHTNNFVAVIPGQPPGNPTMWDRYAGVFNSPNQNQTALLRLTYAANETHTFEASATSRQLTGQNGFGGIDTRESAIDFTNSVNTVSLRHRWLPAAGLANELSLQFVGWTTENHPVVVGPSFKYPTLSTGHGDAVAEIHETQLRAIEHLTYGIGSGPGSHLLKGGIEVARLSADQFTPTNAEGTFRFKTETGSPDQANLGVGFYDPRSDRDALAALSGWDVGIYLNDEWHPTTRLVLNLGLRYDAELNAMNNDFTVPWLSDSTLASRPELQGLLNHGDRKDDLDNLSPRFSFSWDVAGNRRAYIRGGFGIMFDRVPGFIPFAERQSATWRIYTFTNPNTLDPDELRNRIIAGVGPPTPPAVTLLPHRMEVPENRQWSVGLGAQLTPALSLNLDYVDQDVRHLFAVTSLNWLDVSQTPARRTLSAAYGTIGVWGDFARARYRALLTSISYAPDTTLRVTLAHTLASALADWDVQSVAVPTTLASQYYSMQRTSGDERHRFVLSGSWTVGHGIGVSTIARAASPRPYRTMVGVDVNKDNILDDDWIDGVRYAVPSNAWRNWYRSVDLRITKTVNVRRGTQLLLVGEAFNLFNTENYSGYFGTQRDASGALRPDFGAPSGIYATRQLQIGTRLQF